MRQPRQTLRISEFDPWHFILCSKPAKGHAYKDVPISSVIWVHKQAWERKWKNVKRRKFSESQDKTPKKSFIVRRDSVWRGAKQGLISNKKLQDIWFFCWFLNVVTLKAIGRVYNGRGQCFLSYYTGTIQGRRESELKSMLHCSKHLLTGRDTEWKGLGVWHPLARRKLTICLPCSCWYSANTLLLWCQLSKWGPCSNW